MSSELAILTILPVNKTVVFYSPIEGKDVLVRTGSIDGDLSFFHALLHAYSKDYICMNTDGRIKFVKKLTSSISRKMDKEKWISLGSIATIPFKENINTMLVDFYKYIEGNEKRYNKTLIKIIKNVVNEDIESFKLITEMIPLTKGFQENILPSAYEKSRKNTITDYKKLIIKSSTNYYTKKFDKLGDSIDNTLITYYVDKLESLVKSILEESEILSYNEYIERIINSSVEVNSHTIGLISEKFDRDIYFIDARTRMPYKENKRDNIHKRKSVIIMWTGGSHYEIVGRLLPGNIIQREFDHKDSIIKRIYTYLYKSENIPNEYPDLIQYLSKDLRHKFHLDASDSEDQEGSSSNRSIHSSDSEPYKSSDEDFDSSLSDSSLTDSYLSDSYKGPKRESITTNSSK
jgi:hypothetical protein